MMNSSHTNEAYAASPFVSFVGIEGSGSTQTSQKHQLWDWDSTNTLPSTTHSLPFYTHTSPTSLLDYPPPPSFFSSNPLPFYFPPPPPLPPSMALHDYPRSFFKLDDGLAGGFGGAGGTPRIGLNLGHRTYFSSGDHQLLLFGRSAHHQPPRCQAEGCRADLSGAKHYHRRHKVCDFHSKAAVVFFPGGVQQRFCQQCSRFHGLSEFDDTKRSCRKRLAEHNRRRRKPQTQPSSKGSGSQSSSSTPTTKPKEESKLSAAAAKPIKQLSSNIKSSNTVAPILSMEGQQKKAQTHFTSCSALSLGGVGGVIQEQRATAFVSEEEKPSPYHYHQQQQQQLQCHFSSPCSSSNTYFHHQNLFNEGSHSTGGGSEMTHQHQSSILQLGQAMFEWDFI